MRMLKAVLKIILLSVILVLTVIQWIVIIAASLSKTVTNLIAGFLFMLAVMGYLMNRSLAMQAVNVAVAAAVIFILPHIATWIIYRITDLNCAMQQFIRS